MIRIEEAEVIFNRGTPDEKKALKNVNLTINQGDFVTIIGSNGAGKTTLFNLIGGTIPISSGNIFFNEKNITRMPEYKRAAFVGRIFQNPLLGTAGNMSLEDNMMITSYKGMKKLQFGVHKMRKTFEKEVKLLNMNLENRMTENVGLFSGGQRQALTLLMMSLSRPELILLDEHTAALDPRNAALVMDLTRKFIVDYKLTALMITHNMKQAIEEGNRLWMMDAGEVILDIDGEEKKNLTVDGLIEKFHALRHKDFTSDQDLLS